MVSRKTNNVNIAIYIGVITHFMTISNRSKAKISMVWQNASIFIYNNRSEF